MDMDSGKKDLSSEKIGGGGCVGEWKSLKQFSRTEGETVRSSKETNFRRLNLKGREVTGG